MKHNRCPPDQVVGRLVRLQEVAADGASLVRVAVEEQAHDGDALVHPAAPSLWSDYWVVFAVLDRVDGLHGLCLPLRGALHRLQHLLDHGEALDVMVRLASPIWDVEGLRQLLVSWRPAQELDVGVLARPGLLLSVHHAIVERLAVGRGPGPTAGRLSCYL